MEIQVASLCDSAADYGGKLCVLGTFDTICAQSLPVVHPQCAIAIRICFKPEDEGEAHFRICLIDADGNDIVPAIEPKISVKIPGDAYFVTRNLVLNLQRLKFEQAGQFSVDIRCGDEILKRIPLRVMLMEEMRQQKGGDA